MNNKSVSAAVLIGVNLLAAPAYATFGIQPKAQVATHGQLSCRLMKVLAHEEQNTISFSSFSDHSVVVFYSSSTPRNII
jgi:hypothetical protein